MSKGKRYESQNSPGEFLTLIGNGHRRELLSYVELPEAARADFDYMLTSETICEDDHYSPRFVSYLGAWYDTAEFERVGTYRDFPVLYRFHGIQTDSFFSGTLVRFLSGDDDGFVTMARYFV